MSDHEPDGFPDRQTILEFIRNSAGKVGKREIAREFGIKGSDRIQLKKILRDLAAEGQIETDKLSGLRLAGDLPAVCMIEITGRNSEGAYIGKPTQSASEPAPIIEIQELRRAKQAPVQIGDRALARLTRKSQTRYIARIIKLISQSTERVIGIVRKSGAQLRLVPADRRERYDYDLAADAGFSENDVIIAERIESRRRGERKARFVSRIGAADAPDVFSMISIAEQSIRFTFSDEILAEADALPALPARPRTDLTALDFITIDPADARDHDDAIAVTVTDTGFDLTVAIADVAAFVSPGSEIDLEARRRGNSVYMPDRVIPMLPERLSNDLCSLRAHETRPALVCHIAIGPDGERRSHRFDRALIRIADAYSYEQAQAVFDRLPTSPKADKSSHILAPIWACYQAMVIARENRRPLDLNRPERKIRLDDRGQISSISMPPRLEAHRLIEEMMVCANRCAAEQLERKQTPLIYRVHDAPSLEKVKGFSNFIRPLGIKLNRGQTLLPQLFNQILQSAPAEAHADMISEAVLRTQAQAAYATENIGHFGLNLSHYAHFTSPIRRYADLIVHRGLISALGLGEDGLSETDKAQMVDTAERISQSERRAMMAERAANERYLSAFMSKRVGETFDGMITGLSRAGLFIRLHETGAEGLAPISRLGGERFVVDDDGYTMTGLASGLTFKLGEAVEVTLEETIPVKGGLLFSLEAGGQFSSRKKSAATKKQKKTRPKKAKPKR